MWARHPRSRFGESKLPAILGDHTPGAESRCISAPAVAGVISAYLLYRPCFKVTWLLGVIPLRLRAFWIIGFWAIWQVIDIASRVDDGVAYWAHIGGLITGAILFVVMRPAGVRLFECVEPGKAQAAGTSIS